MHFPFFSQVVFSEKTIWKLTKRKKKVQIHIHITKRIDNFCEWIFRSSYCLFIFFCSFFFFFCPVLLAYVSVDFTCACALFVQTHLLLTFPYSSSSSFVFFLLCALIGYHFLFVLFTTFRSNTVQKFEKKNTRPTVTHNDETNDRRMFTVYAGPKYMFDRYLSSIKHDNQDVRVYPKQYEHNLLCDTPN